MYSIAIKGGSPEMTKTLQLSLSRLLAGGKPEHLQFLTSNDTLFDVFDAQITVARDLLRGPLSITGLDNSGRFCSVEFCPPGNQGTASSYDN